MSRAESMAVALNFRQQLEVLSLQQREDSGRNLIVYNLPPSAAYNEVRTLFSPYGLVCDLQLRSRRFPPTEGITHAYVKYYSQQAAAQAVVAFNRRRVSLRGHHLRLAYADSAWAKHGRHAASQPPMAATAATAASEHTPSAAAAECHASGAPAASTELVSPRLRMLHPDRQLEVLRYHLGINAIRLEILHWDSRGLGEMLVARPPTAAPASHALPAADRQLENTPVLVLRAKVLGIDRDLYSGVWAEDVRQEYLELESRRRVRSSVRIQGLQYARTIALRRLLQDVRLIRRATGSVVPCLEIRPGNPSEWLETWVAENLEVVPATDTWEVDNFGGQGAAIPAEDEDSKMEEAMLYAAATLDAAAMTAELQGDL